MRSTAHSWGAQELVVLTCPQAAPPATHPVCVLFVSTPSICRSVPLQEVFELAALPGTSDEARRRVLHFAVVGGGPTGVEFAGTLRDFVRGDLARKYPE
jgi:hypothetical protein